MTERNYDLVEDDRWKKKGHEILPKRSEPVVCPKCKGIGTVPGVNGYIDCPHCQGLGEIE